MVCNLRVLGMVGWEMKPNITLQPDRFTRRGIFGILFVRCAA